MLEAINICNLSFENMLEIWILKIHIRSLSGAGPGAGIGLVLIALSTYTF